MEMRRRSIRLRNHDYSQSGYYFITICTKNRECLFGDIVNGEIKLNNMGKIIENVWKSLPNHHPVELDVFQIMPNHVHFVLIIYRRRGIACNAQPNTMRNAQYDVGFARKTPTFGTVTTGSLSC